MSALPTPSAEVARAINGRLLLQFYYDGHLRVVMPAALGSHITTGNVVLRAYQVRGTGSSRVVPYWDLFKVEKIERLAILDESFADDPPDYKRDDSHISPVTAQL